MYHNILIFLILTWNIINSTHQADLVVFRDGYSIRKSPIVKRNAVANAPKIKEFIVKTTVANRFAETSVLSKVENADTYAKQTTFSVVLRERAFISGFHMEVNGKIYKAFVKDKKEAEKIYNNSTASGQTAAHVAVSARNSNRFTVNINIEPNSKVNFYLTYEELLQRQNGLYEVIANIQPGQIVKKLQVQVEIKESSPLLFVNTPALRSGNALIANNINLDPHAKIKIANTSALVRFYPDINRQMKFACAGLGNTEYDGFAGQFVVQYDVKRTQGGETLFQDGFFINFFAPSKLEPIPKHVVFVLDTSGSMAGTKIIQLKDAMATILSQLYPDDVFSIVQYAHFVRAWDINSNAIDMIPPGPNYGNLASQLQQRNTPQQIPATLKNIETAKAIINRFIADGATNCMGGLEVALFLIKRVQEQYQSLHKPILVFITDGQPNEGISSTSQIIQLITNINSKEYNTPIYSVAIGGAKKSDWNFLEALSVESKAKLTRIQDVNGKDSDIAYQLKKFYELISTPTLRDITYKNLPASGQFTQLYFPLFFNGSEIVIAGKGIPGKKMKPIKVSAIGKNGTLELEAKIGVPITRLERVWAYLIVKQMIDESHATMQSNKTELEKLALGLALNYSLVTELTSLVVVKPDGINTAVSAVNALNGIFAKPPDELPMCNNITGWIINNFGTTEGSIISQHTTTRSTPRTTRSTTTTITTTTPTTTTSTTTISTTTEVDVIPESDFGIQVPTILTTTTDATSIYQKHYTTCQNMPFGCCPDGVTPATGNNFSGCDPIPKSESCSLPQSEGKCYKTFVRHTMKWAYNSNLGECRQFWYSGCEGTNNRFASKQDCEGVCINVTGPDRCKLPIVLGNCAKFSLAWFYDQRTDDCIKRMYSGCSGNSNRFSSKFECLQLCASPAKKIKAQDACFLDRSSGNCSKYDRFYFYDRTIGMCRSFWYGGCGGNDNRFQTKEECDKVCINPDDQDVCYLPAVKGTCNQNHRRWFFDKDKTMCSQFSFSGCRGNKNNFETREECHKTCGGDLTEDLQESCILKQDSGPCTNYTIKWTFDEQRGECTRFWYGGCDGNDNKFNSLEECQKICINPPGKDACKLPQISGKCSQNLQRWFYDKYKKQCREFVYKGCSGNSNNFLSLDECNQLCS